MLTLPHLLRYCTDISVAVFDSPIFFNSDNDPVYVVMCLACKDKASHLERLQHIAYKFLDDAHLVRGAFESARPVMNSLPCSMSRELEYI